MPKYLIQGRYTAEGARGVQKDGGSKRRKVAEALLKEAGGKLEAFYYVFGDVDFMGIAEAPDNVSIAALSLAINSSGVTSIKTVPLITPEEMDLAAKKKMDYRPPGQ